MLRTGRFTEWVNDLLTTVYDEKLYELWLYRVHDKSYTEFRESVLATCDAETVVEDDVKATVLRSKSMLDSFTPSATERG